MEGSLNANMTLEDFEKSLAEAKKSEVKTNSHHRQKGSKDHQSCYRYHRDDAEPRHRHKRRRYSRDERGDQHHVHRRAQRSPKQGTSEDDAYGIREEGVRKDGGIQNSPEDRAHVITSHGEMQRDAWMEEPLALDIDYTQKGVKKPTEASTAKSSKVDFELKVYENELNKHHLKDLTEGKEIPQEMTEENSKHSVDYSFGDVGAQWRMTKLKGVYRRAEETGRLVDDVAEEQYGDLQAFDDAREEQIELDRRDTYGEGYVGKEKPSGEFFEERKLAMGIRKDNSKSNDSDDDVMHLPQGVNIEESGVDNAPMDQTALNRLKAQMLKAKVRGSSDAPKLEAKYNSAVAGLAKRKHSDLIVPDAMDNRMLAGSRKGETTSVDNKRGRERRLVEENENMSIEDMVRQERRSRHHAGGNGQRFAERIAKDAKFDNDLDYMDENANKLAKRVQKSEINLRNTAISDFQKMNRALDKCPLCHHEDTNMPPVAPVVSLATRVYLTLPTEPEISDGGACIIPMQHRGNLLECDDDEWEEIRVIRMLDYFYC